MDLLSASLISDLIVAAATLGLFDDSLAIFVQTKLKERCELAIFAQIALDLLLGLSRWHQQLRFIFLLLPDLL